MEKLYCILWKMAIINEKKIAKPSVKYIFLYFFFLDQRKFPDFPLKREKSPYIFLNQG